MKKTIGFVAVFLVASSFAMDNAAPFFVKKYSPCFSDVPAFFKMLGSYRKFVNFGLEVDLAIENADKVFDKNSADYCAYVEKCKKQKSEIEKCSPELFTAFLDCEKEFSSESPDPATVKSKASGLKLVFKQQELEGKVLLSSLVTKDGKKMASASCLDLGKGSWLLATIGTDRTLRGKGAGSELFHKTIDVLREKGAKTVAIDAEPTVDLTEEEAVNFTLKDSLKMNTRLHRFYRKLGAVDKEGNGEFEYTIPTKK